MIEALPILAGLQTVDKAMQNVKACKGETVKGGGEPPFTLD